MKMHCPNCTESSELTFEVDWKSFACPYCQTLYFKGANGYERQSNFLRKTTLPIPLHLGQQGVIEDELWEVTGICIKYPIKENFGWQEFILHNKTGECCYLSEYNGYWTLSKEIENKGEFHLREGMGFKHQEKFYRIFHNSRYRTSYAAGFFDHFLPETGVAKDYINVPNALLLEQNGSDLPFVYEARYVSQQEIQAAFPDIVLPERYGPGMLEPFPIHTTELWSVLGIVGIFLIFCQMLIAGYFPSYPVLSDYVLMPDSVATVTHVSPSFTCTGHTAPVKISLSAPVNNSWAAVDFCLVNEETKEERYGTVDVAYYHGVEDGVNWSEGDVKPSIKLCGVKPGPYHLVMEISKAPNTPELKALQYSVTARASTLGNLLLALGLLLAAGAAIALWQANFEQQRWMKSDFPPASSEEE